MNAILSAFLAGLLIFAIFSCAQKVSPVNGKDCFETKGDSVVYDCKDKPVSGYGGYNSPPALNLFRPGRFEGLNSPGW